MAKINSGNSEADNVSNSQENQVTKIHRIVEHVFEEHRKFVVIGMTGRIGSGCTTASDLLCKDFSDLELLQPSLTDISSREDREYAIIHKHAKSNWEPFLKIAARDAIVTYVINKDASELSKWIKFFFDITDNNMITEFEAQYNSLCTLELKATNDKFLKFCNSRKNYIKKKNKKELYVYLKETLPVFSGRLKDLLSSITKSRDSYTLLFQWFGNNIRTSGDCLNSNGTGVHYFELAERINSFIKIYRECCESERCCIVIDSIKTPLEASYLRDRYSAFYLLAMNIDENVRFSRLNDVVGLTRMQILQADICEYPKHLKALKEFIKDYNEVENNQGESAEDNEWKVYEKYKKWFGESSQVIKNFAHQNVEECVQKADIHISSSDSVGNFFDLKKKIVRYITLIMHPGIVLPTSVERCMQIAFSAKVNSGCASRQIGAVVTDSSFNLRSIGWNDPPECVESCVYRNLEYIASGNDSLAYSNYERGVDSETNSKQFFEHLKERYKAFPEEDIKDRYPIFCFKDEYNSFSNTNNQVHTRALHGEEKAFLSIIKHGGKDVDGGFLFTTSSPCELCAKKAYDLGISNIYYIEPYPGITQAHVLGVGNYKDKPIPAYHLFTGAIGRAYTKIYTPVFPAKDELEWRGFTKNNKTRNKAVNETTMNSNGQSQEESAQDKVASASGKEELSTVTTMKTR